MSGVKASMYYRPVIAAAAMVATPWCPAFSQTVPAPADAPQAESSPSKGDLMVGDIVVTAQKRSQNIQRVSVAVSAIGKDGLAMLGRQDISAITSQIPNVQANTYSATQVVFNIRGVSQNDFADSQEAPIAFYNDEVYVASLGAISGQNFDLERVETLRGPQGSLFGRNATGGLVQVFSAKPTKSLEGYGTLTIGSYGQISSEAAISGPLSDWLRGRLAFSSNHNDGYLSNSVGPKKGYTDFYAVRAQLEGDSGESGKLLLKFQALRNDHDSAGLYGHTTAVPNQYGVGAPVGANEDPYGTCPGCDAFGYKDPTNNPYVSNTQDPGLFNRTYLTGTARYTQDFAFATLTSITDYQSLKKRYRDDDDGGPLDLFVYESDQTLSQFSQEVRLNGDSGGVNWTVGGYLFHLNTNNRYVADFKVFPLRQNYSTHIITNSEAIFGQVEYPLTDNIIVIGGARYSWERKTLDYVAGADGVDISFVNPDNSPDIARRSFRNYSGKIGIDYKPNEFVLLYASVNRGNKAGGFGTLSSLPADLSRMTYGEEILTSYEGGFKLTLMDRRMRFNGGIFHYVYDGYQAYSIIENSQFITNNKARITGVETELGGTLGDGFTYNIFGTYLDAKVFDIAMPSGDILTRRMPQAPKWSVGGMARYEWEQFAGKLAVSTNWKWNSSLYFDAFNSPIGYQKAYATGDVRIEYKPNDYPIELAVFVQNVTDKKYLTYSTDLSFISVAQHVFGKPRWFGGSVTVRIP